MLYLQHTTHVPTTCALSTAHHCLCPIYSTPLLVPYLQHTTCALFTAHHSCARHLCSSYSTPLLCPIYSTPLLVPYLQHTTPVPYLQHTTPVLYLQHTTCALFTAHHSCALLTAHPSCALEGFGTNLKVSQTSECISWDINIMVT